jgi:hypothetical protein
MDKDEFRRGLVTAILGGTIGSIVSLLAFLALGVESPLYVIMIPGRVLANLIDKSGSWLTLVAFFFGSFMGWAAVSALAFFAWISIKREHHQ